MTSAARPPAHGLDRARLYLVSPARLTAGPAVDLIPDLVAAGVDIVQLREKEMEAGDVVAHAGPLAAACRAAGIPFVVNDRPDIARAVEADCVHLGTTDLPVAAARRVLPPDAIVGRSSHVRSDIEDALGGTAGPVDYLAVGPVFETPTKPGRPAVGLGLIEHAAHRIDIPWFAIGGIDRSNLERVLAAGARRIVVVRAVTEASDPPAAAAELRALLDASWGEPISG
ncbi:MAG: thiamine phosphate synthase [Actinomycetota bacterium]